MARDAAAPRAHLVMVPNPPYHPRRRFRARDGERSRSTAARGSPTATSASTTRALFANFRADAKLKMLPLYSDWIARGLVSRRALRRPLGQRRHARRPRRARRAAARAARSDSHADIATTHDRSRPTQPAARLSRPAALRRDPRPSTSRPRRRAARAARAPPSSASRPIRVAADVGQRWSSRWPTRSTASIARGARSPSQCGRQHAGAARRVSRATCRRSPRSTPTSAQDVRLYARYRALRDVAGVRVARRRATQRVDRQRAARLPAGRRRAAATRRRRASRPSRRSSPSSSAKFDDNVLDATNAWALYVDDAARARRRSRRRDRRGARGSAGRRQAPAGSSRCACPATCR